MRMEQNSRGSYNADFEQFSRFLRGSRNTRETMPCNSNNSVSPETNNNASNNHNNNHNNSHNTDTSLAMVYAVKQAWQNIYDPEIALVNGTIFEELNKPFYHSGCSMNNGCRGNNAGGGCLR